MKIGANLRLELTQKGFTFVEIMLVAFLIGLSATFAVISIGNRSDAKITHMEARRFAALVNHVQDESILSGQPMGIELSAKDGSYRFFVYNDGWQAVEDESLRERQLPEGLSLNVEYIETGAPEKPDRGAHKFTPKAVHELLNRSLFDEGSSELSDSDDTKHALYEKEDLILVEPTGLMREFSATIAGKARQYVIKLDEYGKAIIEDDAS